jgi:hypothetical protein
MWELLEIAVTLSCLEYNIFRKIRRVKSKRKDTYGSNNLADNFFGLAVPQYCTIEPCFS